VQNNHVFPACDNDDKKAPTKAHSQPIVVAIQHNVKIASTTTTTTTTTSISTTTTTTTTTTTY
jgi:hypothetical protein